MKTLLLAASLAALGLASPASAEPANGRVVVSTSGLDLATAAGQRALDLRVLHAASALCGTPSPADGRGRAAYQACRDDARASAAVQLARRQGAVEIAARR